MTTHFADRLADAVRRAGNPLCVGLDPRWESLPKAIRDRHDAGSLDGVAAAYEAFCLRVLDLVAGQVAVVKPQSAFFESCGPAGLRALQVVTRRAKELGLLVVLDAKRGDIASTATAYADAAFGGTPVAGTSLPVWDSDALTVNPYLGRDAVEPFIRSARQTGRGLFVLVRTSNPGSGQFQDLDCGGRKFYRHVADAVTAWNSENIGASGFGDVGAVVGATHPAELAELRTAMPGVWFLVPGYGAQGGSAADVAAGFRKDGLGAIVNSSRGITFPFQPDDRAWEDAIVAATRRSVSELSAATHG
ncbi:MAG TPA: orotidine-5'-phosphate decarboxylase [Gemmataceae bacterium]|jgi:orotidine-5'-phosphate decarboxylase|nr:orotidine-5'-phosphate decarboxylase [Gemmataceae bacterium]